MTKRGKFIVIEGIDGAGKTKQVEFLYRRLKKIKLKILLADFPRYNDSVWGDLVGNFLRGKFGKLEDVDPHLALLPYMIDEYTWSRDIGRPWVEKGGIILSNRYFTSNVHQIARLKTTARKKFRDWLWKTGYEKLGILRPDLVIFLDLRPDIARRLLRTKAKRGYLKGKKKDILEKDWNHQASAYNEYLRTVKENAYWVRVSCMVGNEADSPRNVRNRVWLETSKILGL